MIHYPFNVIQKISKSKMDTVKVSMVNCATMVKSLVGFTPLLLREVDYCFIGEEWETIMIAQFQAMQHEQFRQKYGEEY